MHKPASRTNATLADHAADQLAFIRDTMVRAGRFTAVSGAGMIGVGFIGTAAAILTPRLPTRGTWLAA